MILIVEWLQGLAGINWRFFGVQFASWVGTLFICGAGTALLFAQVRTMIPLGPLPAPLQSLIQFVEHWMDLRSDMDLRSGMDLRSDLDQLGVLEPGGTDLRSVSYRIPGNFGGCLFWSAGESPTPPLAVL